MNRIISKAAALMLLAVLMMPSFAFAATHDATEDNSSDTATIYLGKVLTVNQENKFPNIRNFSFEVEAVKAWDNANTSSDISGAVIQPAGMPMPATSNAAHHNVNVSGTKAEVTIGDFKGTANTSKADTSTEKFRTTPLNIKFTKAGYYMYKVSEKASEPADVPGVRYDDSYYYVIVYVCNKTDAEGNTLPGVYVHDITSYRNDPDSSNQPDLSDIQNTTDNGGISAVDNTYDNFAKVGSSGDEPGTDPETGLPVGPDKLEAYKFWNDQTTHDVVITNNVTGNLGDVSKEFAMTVTLKGLEPGVTYTTNVPAEFKTDNKETSASADLVNASSGTVNTQAKTFTSSADGEAAFLIKLADDEVFVMNALPAGATYKVEEMASDHIASYSVSSTGDNAVIAKASDANTKDQTAISTALETVDMISNVSRRADAESDDQTVTIAFTNHRNLATVTGLPYYGDFTYIMIAILATGAVILAAGVRRLREEYADQD